MNEPQFTWGSTVAVTSEAGGQVAEVCGVRQNKDGRWLYVVEYADGSSEELDEERLTGA